MIKFQQSQALTTHFVSFWNIVQANVWFCKQIADKESKQT